MAPKKVAVKVPVKKATAPKKVAAVKKVAPKINPVDAPLRYVDCLSTENCQAFADLAEDRGYNCSRDYDGQFLHLSDDKTAEFSDYASSMFVEISLKEFLELEKEGTIVLNGNKYKIDKDAEEVDVDGNIMTFAEVKALLRIHAAGPELLDDVQNLKEVLFHHELSSYGTGLSLGCQDLSGADVAAFKEKFVAIAGAL